MALIENLTEEDQALLQTVLENMQKANPQLAWEINPMESDSDISSRLLLLEQKIDKLINKLELIFGDQILHNGKFINIKH